MPLYIRLRDACLTTSILIYLIGKTLILIFLLETNGKTLTTKGAQVDAVPKKPAAAKLQEAAPLGEVPLEAGVHAHDAPGRRTGVAHPQMRILGAFQAANTMHDIGFIRNSFSTHG